MVEAVIFDVDGTLVDSVDLHAQCWKEAFEKYGKPVPFDQVRRLIGKGGDELLPSILSPDEQKRFGAELETFRTDLWKRAYASKVKPFPSVRELFQALKNKGVKIALGSSAKKDELASYEKMLKIEDLIDVRTTSDDADKSKPAPDIFDAVMSRLKTDKRRTLVVGDTPFDVRAANRAELETIAVLSGGFPEEELRATGAVKVYRDPPDLLRHLEEWAGER